MEKQKKKRKHSDYSRKGCTQCKKSHVKCDEKYPVCTRCQKRKIECKYFINFLMENSNSMMKKPTKSSHLWSSSIKPSSSKSASEILPTANSLHITATNDSINFDEPNKNFDTDHKIDDNSSIITNGEPSLESHSVQFYIENPGVPNTSSKLSKYHASDYQSQKSTIPNQTAIFIESPHSSIHTPKSPESSTLSPIMSYKKSIQFSNLQLSDMPTNNNTNNNNYNNNKSPHPASLSDCSENSLYTMPKLNLNDLISVDAKDLPYLERKYSNSSTNSNNIYNTDNFLYTETLYPNLNLFHIPWDGGPMVYFIDVIQRNDPLLFQNDILLTDPKMKDFIWTITKITKFFYTFVLFSESSLISVLDLCFKLGTKNSIFQNIMNYHSALHIIRIYNEANNNLMANLWEIKVKIPSFKNCIDYLKNGLVNTNSFSDLVILTFAVVIIFSGNASDKSWRTHLQGSYQLISKSYQLKKYVNFDNDFDIAALKLFDIIVEWYNHTSFLSGISSLNGYYNRNLNFNKNKSSSNLAITKNNFNLMAGHCLEISSLISNIHQFLTIFNSNGTNLSGLNFVYFILKKDKSSKILIEIKKYGLEFLNQLNFLLNNYNYKRLDLEDFKMDLSIKYCNLIYMNGIKLYVIYFLIGNRNKAEIRSLLRDILDLIYSMPYRSSCAIICHWNIYMSAVISLLIDDLQIFDHFMNILKVFQLNGMEITSIGILNRIKDILEIGDYEQLLSDQNDFVIY